MKIIPQETYLIFVIDDEQSNVESLPNILEFEKYRMIRAASSESGAGISGRETIELAQLDIKISSFDGFEIPPRIYVHRKTKGTPFEVDAYRQIVKSRLCAGTGLDFASGKNRVEAHNGKLLIQGKRQVVNSLYFT